MKRTALVLSAALSLAAILAPPALADGAIRHGDDTLTCEALSAEAGKLEDAEVRRAQRAETGRKFMGFAGSALASAGPGMIARADAGEGTILAQQMMRSVGSQASATAAQGAAPPPAGPQARRLERVRTLMTEKSC
ncbi:MAG: hypothetical protein C0481_17610 [Phenylobacterium sp.]|uniref:hypothetical protein n=1 Tax=Phenylobacterium sp. TaxID=1871053 RepID=UPI0025FB605A|nr:hypothetical protein [Phenylobacterium sp.]MBA4013681.1 hypothetical protein [Phenylobacterium sp.]